MISLAAAVLVLAAQPPASARALPPVAKGKTGECEKLARDGRNAEAISCLQGVLKNHPEDLEAGNALGAVYASVHKYPEALAAFEGVLKKSPEDPVALNGRAVVLFALKRFDDAFAALSTAIKADPSNAQAVDNLARLALEHGKLDVAEDCFRHVLEVSPDDQQAHLGLGELAIARKKYADAQTMLTRAVELDPKDPRANWILGKLIAQQAPGEAIPYLSRAAQLAPDSPDTWYDLGLARLELDQTMEAGADFTKAEKLAPYDPSIDLQLGKVYLQLGRFGEAAAHLEQALKEKPSPQDEASIHFHLALVREKQGRSRDAEQEYGTAIALKKDFTLAQVNLGAIYVEQKRTKEAIARFQEALKQEPDSGLAHFDLGLALLQDGDAAGGKAELEKAAAIFPADHPLHQRALDLAAGKNLTKGGRTPATAEKKSDKPSLGGSGNP